MSWDGPSKVKNRIGKVDNTTRKYAIVIDESCDTMKN